MLFQLIFGNGAGGCCPAKVKVAIVGRDGAVDIAGGTGGVINSNGFGGTGGAATQSITGSDQIGIAAIIQMGLGQCLAGAII